MKNISDKRAHIVVVTTAYAPFIGGAEVAVQEIIQKTSEAFRYTVVTARMDKKLPAHDVWNGVDVVRVGWGTSLDKLWLIVVFPLYAWKLRPKLVWAIMASYAGAAACLSNMLRKTPYVLTLQEGDDLDRLEQRLRFVAPLFRLIFARAQSVQAIAQFLARWAQKMGAQTEAAVIPNGVSCEVFAMSESERQEFRNDVRDDLHIPEDAFVVLSVSRLVEKNGIADLLEAVRTMSDTHVLLVGDGKLRASLEAQCVDFSDRVHFLGTHQQNELRRYAAAADVFCRPAHSEGQGIAFLEGLCMGLPIVATNVGGIPEIIEHNLHGLLVEARNVIELRKALSDLQEDTVKRSQMIVAGGSHVKDFSWNLLAPKIENWLSSNIK